MSRVLGGVWLAYSPRLLSAIGRQRFGLTAGAALAWGIVLALVLPFFGLFLFDWWSDYPTCRVADLRDICPVVPDVRDLLAECARLRAELDGDGSPSSDPLRAFGVRGCLELQTEEIARLRQALDACRQERESLRLEGMATEAQRIRDNSYLVAATDAAEARVQALEAELATHHDCVQQAQDEMIAVHDEIEAKRDGIEQQLASLSAALHGLQVEIRQGADIVLA